jgi:imidazolonepropionase-like amidohydrolase
VTLVRGERIEAVDPEGQVGPPSDATVVDLPNMTLLPGLIEGHAHVLLRPYDEASGDEQMLKEALALRVARATNHARSTLLAGFTTIRDHRTEGAAYADVGLKQAIDQGIIPGPRMIVATRAIVATRSYGPRGFDPSFRVPQGAEEADGIDALTRVVRDQIGHGADQGVCGLSLGAGRRDAADVPDRRAQADRRDGAFERPRCGPARDRGRGDAARGSRGRRDHRARRRGDAGRESLRGRNETRPRRGFSCLPS